MAGSVAEGVADAVLRWFQASTVCQKKVPPTEWTVVAGIVVHTDDGCSSPASDGNDSSTFRVLTGATGNKCLGRRDLNAHGLVVNDCHAEILARRALLRYLYSEALTWATGREDPALSLFERHRGSQRLVLKPQHTLHLYISEAPCGDAAIYRLRDDIVEELVRQRMERSADAAKEEESRSTPAIDAEERSAFRLTGAKAKRKHDEIASTNEEPRQQEDQQLQEKRFDQTVGIARVKSGRSDLPPEKQTLSMSCSDKLAKWNVVGVQGTLLLQWYEPIFLRSIVVSRDEACISVATQHQALKRAISGRFEGSHLQAAAGATEDPFLACQVHVVVSRDREFQRRRTKERAPSSLALNWSLQMAHWRDAIQDALCEQRTKSDAQSRFLLKFFQAPEVEVLNAATGLKQGAKKPSKMHDIEMQKVASRVTKWMFFLAFRRIVACENDVNKELEAPSHAISSLPYLQLKGAVPARITLSSSSSPRSPPRDEESKAHQHLRERRKQFFDAIKTWVGVPPVYKQFSI